MCNLLCAIIYVQLITYNNFYALCASLTTHHHHHHYYQYTRNAKRNHSTNRSSNYIHLKIKLWAKFTPPKLIMFDYQN